MNSTSRVIAYLASGQIGMLLYHSIAHMTGAFPAPFIEVMGYAIAYLALPLLVSSIVYCVGLRIYSLEFFHRYIRTNGFFIAGVVQGLLFYPILALVTTLLSQQPLTSQQAWANVTIIILCSAAIGLLPPSLFAIVHARGLRAS